MSRKSYLEAEGGANQVPILGIGVTSREYSRPPSKTKDSFWIEARSPYPDTLGDPRLVGKWIVFVALRKLDVSWDRIRKSTVESRLGFLSKSSTAKKNFAPNVIPSRVIQVYTHDYYDMDDVLRVGRELNDLGFGIENPMYYESDDTKYAHRNVVKGDSNLSMYRCLKGRFWSRDEKNIWSEIW